MQIVPVFDGGDDGEWHRWVENAVLLEPWEDASDVPASMPVGTLVIRKA